LEKPDHVNSHRIRDQGHSGWTLQGNSTILLVLVILILVLILLIVLLIIIILLDFQNEEMAIAAKLTQAEVAALRLYTGIIILQSIIYHRLLLYSHYQLGPIYAAWNTALRLYNDNHLLLLQWQTSISILYSAVFKLSFLSKPGKVYRGVNEAVMKLPESFYKEDGDRFAGGVELAFMSTSYDKNVAIEYAAKGNHYHHSSI